MSFITKLNFTADKEKMSADLQHLLSICPWPEHVFKKTPGNQIGVTHRLNATDVWTDGQGSLVDRLTGKVLAKESDFTEYNPHLPNYTKSILEKLASFENIKFGRIRYMRLMPKSGLSIHSDNEKRYHYVLETNPHALFGHYTGEEPTVANCYHIPADGHFYKVDTTQTHFVYNGGWEPRIHLVITEIK